MYKLPFSGFHLGGERAFTPTWKFCAPLGDFSPLKLNTAHYTHALPKCLLMCFCPPPPPPPPPRLVDFSPLKLNSAHDMHTPFCCSCCCPFVCFFSLFVLSVCAAAEVVCTKLKDIPTCCISHSTAWLRNQTTK